MSTPATVLVARGDDGSATRTSPGVAVDHLHRLRSDFRVGLGLLNNTTPTVHEAVKALADTRVEEIAMVPTDLVPTTDHPPILAHARNGVGAANPGPSIVIARPIGPDTDLPNVLDIRLREALHRVNAVEVDVLVLAYPNGGDLRGGSLLARRIRQQNAHHKFPVQLVQNDITSHATALAINMLRGQGRRHIAVGSLPLTPGPVFRVHQQAAIRVGVLTVTPPITEDPRVTELIPARYALTAMQPLDIDLHKDGT